jgi:hypothetical protein
MDGHARGFRWWRQIAGRGALIITAALIVASGTFALVAVLSHVIPDRPGSRREMERRDQRSRERRAASLSRGVPDVALQLLLIGGIGWSGRRFLGLTLKD